MTAYTITQKREFDGLCRSAICGHGVEYRGEMLCTHEICPFTVAEDGTKRSLAYVPEYRVSANARQTVAALGLAFMLAETVTGQSDDEQLNKIADDLRRRTMVVFSLWPYEQIKSEQIDARFEKVREKYLKDGATLPMLASFVIAELEKSMNRLKKGSALLVILERICYILDRLRNYHDPEMDSDEDYAAAAAASTENV